MYKLVLIIISCLLSEVSFSNNMSLNLNSEYVLEIYKNGKVMDRIDFFRNLKKKEKEGEVSLSQSELSLNNNDNYYILEIDLFSSRFYEEFYIKNNKDIFLIERLITTSVAKDDFDVKKEVCEFVINKDIKNYEYVLADNKQNGRCETFYMLDNSLYDLENYLLSIRNNDMLLLEIDRTRLDWYLKRFPLSVKTVTRYNNIAFYLGESSNKESRGVAEFLLKKVISEFPNRIVAYLNLGDLYWKEGEKNKAILMYKIYINKIEHNGKRDKIPKRVIDRVTNE
ncbi:tetratricopeptide repeat protein [Actinobacillus vicugnae]|uniref:tetratricopeptide repeat protein n=1 Tax=Actinobacillus vicugnae TaxID=2573093 RepID=UPI0012428F35|nr:tetratricopeptide repeat protein [Actinobacillus vicugnae]